MTTVRATASVGWQPSKQWMRLAAVARERASEQSAKAAASDLEVAGPHREQEAYLVRLAEVYEQRAKAV